MGIKARIFWQHSSIFRKDGLARFSPLKELNIGRVKLRGMMAFYIDRDSPATISTYRIMHGVAIVDFELDSQ